MAPLWAVAADYVVMDEGATFLVHSALAAGPGGTLLRACGANVRIASFLGARTLTSERDIETWLGFAPGTGGPPWAELDLAAALSHGWADFAGDLTMARTFVAVLAGTPRALHPATGRAAALRGRPEVSDLAQPRAGEAAAAAIAADHIQALAVTSAKIAAAAITADKLAAGSITAEKLAAGAVTADKIAAGQLKTTDYAEDANGVPMAGAKLDHQGTALKAAAGSIQLGYFAKVSVPVAGGGAPSIQGTPYGISAVSLMSYMGFNVLRVTFSYALGIPGAPKPYFVLLASPGLSSMAPTARLHAVQQSHDFCDIGLVAPSGSLNINALSIAFDVGILSLW